MAVICVVFSTTGISSSRKGGLARGEQHGADRADGCRFRRRRDAVEDRAEHRDDQQHGREQRFEQAGRSVRRAQQRRRPGNLPAASTAIATR